MALDEIKRNDDKILTTEYKLTDDQIHIITDEKVNPSVIKLNQKEISNYDEHILGVTILFMILYNVISNLKKTMILIMIK